VPSVEVCVDVPAELYEQMRKRAEQGGITVEELVIRALVNALED